jgi:hypothetical protein
LTAGVNYIITMPTEANPSRLKDFKNKGRDVEVNTQK